VVEEDNSFLRAFLALGCSKELLKHVSIRLVQLDAAHMKHHMYKHVVMVLETHDGNNKLFPIAVALCPKENEDNYVWFLNLCKQHFGADLLNSTEMTVISDRQKGIVAALTAVLEAIYKVHCGKHLLTDVHAQQPKLKLHTNEFWTMAKATTATVFQAVFDKLDWNTQNYLNTVDRDTWVLYAIAARGVRLFRKHTSNGVESENARLMDARDNPPLDFLDTFMTLSLKTLNVLKGLAKKQKDVDILTAYAAGQYVRDLRLALKCHTLIGDHDTVYVTYTAGIESHRRTVDLAAKTCSCLGWQQNGRPCLHALAAAQSTQRLQCEVQKAWLLQAFDKQYHATNYRDTVGAAKILLPNRDALIPDGTTKASGRVAQAGRPKKKRIRSAGENPLTGQPAKKYKCGNCRQLGHVYKHCPHPMVVFQQP
jgi:hypothetical protein